MGLEDLKRQQKRQNIKMQNFLSKYEKQLYILYFIGSLYLLFVNLPFLVFFWAWVASSYLIKRIIEKVFNFEMKGDDIKGIFYLMIIYPPALIIAVLFTKTIGL